MHTFRKLPKASPRAKIVTARRGSTLAKCPVCLDLAIICWAGRGLLRYEGRCPSVPAEVVERKASGDAAGGVPVGQEHGEHGPATSALDLATHANGSAMFLDDAARYP